MYETSAEENRLSGAVVDAALKVHRTLGPGLMESVYEQCLFHELELRGIPTARQVAIPIVYESLRVENAYRLDILVGDLVVVEIKAVDQMLPVFEAQLLTYLRLMGLHLGLLINFNVPRIKDGIRRRVI
jgi:GxxExxY protein